MKDSFGSLIRINKSTHKDISEETYENELKRTREQAEVDSLDNETGLRKELASRTFTFMLLVSGFILALVYTYFMDHLKRDEFVPENVMIALITSTFASIVGLVGFMLQGLFKSSSKEKKGNK